MSRSFDRYASVLFLLVGIFFVVESNRLSSQSYGSGVGPDLFPMGLGAILILLSIRLFYETFLYPVEEENRKTLDWKRFLVILGAAIIYAFVMELLGYLISTFLFLVIAFQTMEKGKWIQSIVIAALVSGGIYYLYVNLLQGTLPPFPWM